MCGRKRRNTGSTARISALDAPMALNWLAAAQVALLLILTDNSAALRTPRRALATTSSSSSRSMRPWTSSARSSYTSRLNSISYRTLTTHIPRESRRALGGIRGIERP